MLSQAMLSLTHRAKPSVTAIVFNAPRDGCAVLFNTPMTIWRPCWAGREHYS